MAEPARKLRLVDADTGEVVENADCPKCAEAADQVAGLEKEVRAWRSRYAALKRDKEAEAKASEQWGDAVALWHEWRIATGKEKARWSADRFWLCQPYLAHDGFHVCRFAVWGIAAHPNQKQITPAYTETYTDWELCFRNRGTFERYANRGAAIFGRKLPYSAEDFRQ